jgi:hypothetical protein
MSNRAGKERLLTKGTQSDGREDPASSISSSESRLELTALLSKRQDWCKIGERRRSHRSACVKSPKFDSSIVAPPSMTDPA